MKGLLWLLASVAVQLSGCSTPQSPDTKERVAPNQRELWVYYMEEISGELRTTSINLDNCDTEVERGHNSMVSERRTARCPGDELVVLRSLFTDDKLKIYRADAPHPDSRNQAPTEHAGAAGPEAKAPHGDLAPGLPQNTGGDYQSLLIEYPPGKANPETGETKEGFHFGSPVGADTKLMLTKFRALNDTYFTDKAKSAVER